MVVNGEIGSHSTDVIGGSGGLAADEDDFNAAHQMIENSRAALAEAGGRLVAVQALLFGSSQPWAPLSHSPNLRGVRQHALSLLLKLHGRVTELGTELSSLKENSLAAICYYDAAAFEVKGFWDRAWDNASKAFQLSWDVSKTIAFGGLYGYQVFENTASRIGGAALALGTFRGLDSALYEFNHPKGLFAPVLIGGLSAVDAKLHGTWNESLVAGVSGTIGATNLMRNPFRAPNAFEAAKEIQGARDQDFGVFDTAKNKQVVSLKESKVENKQAPVQKLNDVLGSYQKNTKGTAPMIAVTKYPQSSGPNTYVVDIPSTKDWLGLGSDFSGNANIDAFVGDAKQTKSYQSVVAALKQNGVEVGANLVLVGHSQGGLIANALASDADFNTSYGVKQVITAGSIESSSPVNPEVSYLHLTSPDDLVTVLDQTDPLDQPNVISLVTDYKHNPSYADAHKIESYNDILQETLQHANSISLQQFDEQLQGLLKGSGENPQPTYRFDASVRTETR